MKKETGTNKKESLGAMLHNEVHKKMVDFEDKLNDTKIQIEASRATFEAAIKSINMTIDTWEKNNGDFSKQLNNHGQEIKIIKDKLIHIDQYKEDRDSPQ